VIVAGMIIGFVPTCTMAGAHMLEQLLDQDEFRERARIAALAGDLESFKRCLFEAMRFHPLDREPLRVCTRDYTLANGTGRAHTVKQGQRVLPLTRSAMMDARRFPQPRVFDPERPQYDSMLFGYGLHRCIGAPLAEVQVVHSFRALLEKPNLRR